MSYDELKKIAGQAFYDSPGQCYFCGEPVAFGEPGSSINEVFGNCHTKCLYDMRGEDVPEVLK